MTPASCRSTKRYPASPARRNSATGFAGLIRESVWTHYLKLFLGHAAYAQTLVLAIFMGGMAIGAAAAARSAASIRHPLPTYVVIEAAIGVLAIASHPVFIGATDGFYDIAFVQHLGGFPFAAGKRGLATLLILPQSSLLVAASLVTGAASFTCEIGWIRMISIVLGSETHSFELMLSTFIPALALRGFGSGSALTGRRIRMCPSRISRS